MIEDAYRYFNCVICKECGNVVYAVELNKYYGDESEKKMINYYRHEGFEIFTRVGKRIKKCQCKKADLRNS